MTVLPTIRHQLEQAAERRARTGWRGRLRPGGVRFRAERVILALGVIAALGVALLAVGLLHHARTTTTLAIPKPHSPPAARPLLGGNGIGNITFGQPRAAVTAALERLLGPPHETIPGICGFDRTTDWIGLNIRLRPKDPRLSAELNVYFKHSRFAGYAYFANEEGTGRQRHGVVLAAPGGLTLGDTVARARDLYGQAFVETTLSQGTPPSAKLPRLPAGKVSTESGQIITGIQGSGPQDRVTPQSTVVSIGAGAEPNTPCH